MEYTILNLTKEDAEYIGEKINEIVPREVDANEEEFILKVENENGEKESVSQFSWAYAFYTGENGSLEEIEALMEEHEKAFETSKDIYQKNLKRLSKLRAGLETLKEGSLRHQAVQKQVEYWEEKTQDYSEHHLNCIGLLQGKIFEREL